MSETPISASSVPEAVLIDPPAPPAPPAWEAPPPLSARSQLARLFLGFIWILVPFAIIALAAYWCWPWVHAYIEHFYQ